MELSISGERSKQNMTMSRSAKAKIIEDFNLLKIPQGIDLPYLIREFVMPRMPDGFELQARDKRPSLKSAVDLIIEGVDDKTFEGMSSYPNRSIEFALIKTNSPRPLHPSVSIKRDLQIKKRTTVDESNAYMFSKLLQDLDELCERQWPTIEKRIEEISEILSNSQLEEHETIDSGSDQNQFSEPSLHRFSVGDFTRDPPVKESNIEEIVEAEEQMSSDEDDFVASETSDDQDEHFGKVKDIDIGYWSIRDIHDPKFNEEKLAIQFRAGRLGSFALAVNKFGNFPYQTWDLKSDSRK